MLVHIHSLKKQGDCRISSNGFCCAQLLAKAKNPIKDFDCWNKLPCALAGSIRARHTGSASPRSFFKSFSILFSVSC